MAKLAPVLKRPTEFFTVDIGGGILLDGWMLKPTDFDPNRKYPVIMYVYGEVASQTVLDRWLGGRMLFHRALADAGYIVLSVDNRGTPAPKGAAWRQVVYGTVGDLSSRDQNAAIRALAAKLRVTSCRTCRSIPRRRRPANRSSATFWGGRQPSPARGDSVGFQLASRANAMHRRYDYTPSHPLLGAVRATTLP